MSDGPQLVPPSSEYSSYPPGLLPAEAVTLFTDLMESYLRGLARGLSEYLEATVAASLDGPVQLSRAEFLADAQTDVCRLILDLDGGRGQAFFGLSPGLVTCILGILLVIPQDVQPGQRDSVTDIKLHVMRKFFEILTDELRRAWDSIHVGFDMRPADESDEKPADSGEDPLLVLNCRIKFAAAEETFRLAVPALLVRLVVLDREREAALKPGITRYPGMLNILRQASFELEAVLAGSSLRMSDLLAMQPGEILMLEQPIGAPVECRVNGKPKFRGELIQTGARRALQLA